jgi:hypothetical protein
MTVRRIASSAAVLLVIVAAAAPARGASRDAPRLPDWAREAADRRLEIEPERDTVWLHEERVVEPLAGGGVRRLVRMAAEVRSPDAMRDFHAVGFVYDADDEIVSFRGWSLAPDGTLRAADPEEDTEDDPLTGITADHTDARARRMMIPGLVAGGTLFWEHEVIVRPDLGAEDMFFGAANRPTAFARFELKAGPEWERRLHLARGQELQLTETETGIVLTGRELASLPVVALRPPARELLPHAWVRWWRGDGGRGYRDWNEVGRWYRDLSEEVLDDPGEAAELSRRFAPAEGEPLLPGLQRAFGFAARDVRYVAIEVGIGGHKPYSPAVVCEHRYGDCKDKSFLMRSLVQPWGHRTYPVLARTRGAGEVSPEVPTPAQFNHCIAAIALPDGTGEDLWPVAKIEGIGRVLFVDPTANEGDVRHLPRGVQGTHGLLVDAGGAHLVTLPTQPPEAATTERTLTARLSERGRLRGAELVETWHGTEGSRVRRDFTGRSPAQRREDALEDLQDRFRGARVREHRIAGLDRHDEPVVERTRFEGAVFGQAAPGMLFVEPGRLGYGVVRTALPKPPRRWPLDVGLPSRERVRAELRLPEGWVPESLPLAFELSTEELDAEARWSFTDGVLHYERRVDLLVSEVPAERYRSFYQAVRRIADVDRENIVLVRR